MPKQKKRFRDKDHHVVDAYYDLCEEYDGRNAKSITTKVKKLIEKDPDYFDTYLFLYDILLNEGKISQADTILNTAYERAIQLIVDDKGNWPEVLEWGWLENRHIIRTILTKAIDLWDKGEIDSALDLLRKLLRSNPNDNIGARNYILAIRMNMTFSEFEHRFNKGGFYDNKMFDWFEKNYKKFPDEFDWWDEMTQ